MADEPDRGERHDDRPGPDSQTGGHADEDKAGQDKAAQDKAGKNEADEKPGKNDPGKPRSRKPLIIAAIVLVVVVILGAIYWFATRNDIVTDDAYTAGRSVSDASNVSGYVTRLLVNDNTYVRQGDLLLVIDPRADEAAVRQAAASLQLAQAQLSSAGTDLIEAKVKAPAQLAQAEAQLAQAEAQQADARRNYNRQAQVDRRATAASDIDQAAEQLKSANASVKQAEAQVKTASLVQETIQSAQDAVSQRQAQVVQAQANLKQAEVKLSYNYIRAPQDGWITMRNVELGGFVQAGQQVFYIVLPQTWVVANYKETQLTRMRPGQHVHITVDAYPALKLRGHVQSIQQGSGAQFSAFPAENATGNFVKIVRRVPVKIVIDSGFTGQIPNLPLGISVETTVAVK